MYAYKLGRIIMNSLKPLLHICNKTIASTQPENSICCMFRYHVLVSSWVTVSVAMSTAWLQEWDWLKKMKWAITWLTYVN